MPRSKSWEEVLDEQALYITEVIIIQVWWKSVACWCVLFHMESCPVLYCTFTKTCNKSSVRCSTITELVVSWKPSTRAQIKGWLWSHIQLVTLQLLSVDTFHLTLFTLALQVLVKVQQLISLSVVFSPMSNRADYFLKVLTTNITIQIA